MESRRHTHRNMQKVRLWKTIAVLIVMVLILSGCLYPEHMRGENKASGVEYVTLVQSAIDQYQTKTSVLPIKNSSMETPIYEKYVIDFGRLLESPFLSEVPPNAFEKGGGSQYVLVNVEVKPQVRLLDLVTAQTVNELQNAVSSYKTNHNGALPLGEAVSAGWHTINYEKMGTSMVQVRSVFSGRYLSLLLNKNGQVIVDYGPDIMKLIQEKALTPQETIDLRTLLVEHSMFVPVKSAAYYWRDDEPSIAAG
jgi:hypothetical protein